MSERTPESEAERQGGGEAAESGSGFSLSTTLVAETREALAAGDVEGLVSLVQPLHAADFADLLEQLTSDERELLVAATHHVAEPETLNYLDEDVREEVIELLGPEEVAAAVSELETDDAVEVLEDLDENAKRRILDQIPAEERAVLEQSLSYPEESAGRLMQRDLVAVPSWWNVGQTIDFLRASDDLPDDFYDLFVADPAHRPVGTVRLSRAMRSKRTVPLVELMDTELRLIPVDMNQEAVAHLFRQYGLVSAPVVDEAGRLIGMITVDDVVHVIDEEAEDDLMKLGGVREDDLYRAAAGTAGSRAPWLGVNLATAFLASSVIALFEGSIEKLVALAILMPIVASMGGNAGTQTLTVTVRALAMNELTRANATRFIGKEVLVGVFNGIGFAFLTGGVAALWFQSAHLGAVIGAALIINLLVAGFAGALLPLGLARLRVDPAIASGVFLTTVTDVVGFLSFLGLATLLLL